MERIKGIFTELELYPEYLQHEEVITSEDAAATRGFELRQGIKSLLFTNGKDEWVIVDVPADKLVNQKKVADKLGWSKGKTRMATEEEVMQKTGCKIGAVPPFGHKEKIRVLFDPEIFKNEISTFNIGLRTDSVKIKTAGVKIVFNKIGAEEGDFTR